MDFKKAKKKFLKGISGSYLEKISMWGGYRFLINLSQFLRDPNDKNYVACIVEQFDLERTRLIREGIPPDKWPEDLQGDDWKHRIYKKFGVEESSFNPKNSLKIIPQIKDGLLSLPTKEDTSQALKNDPQTEIKEEVKTETPSPYQTDSFGEILGDQEEGVIPLVNRIRSRW